MNSTHPGLLAAARPTGVTIRSGVGLKCPPALRAPARDAPDRLRDEGVSFGARELPLQRRERLDELGGLERSVSPPDRDLLEDAGLHEPVDRLARRLERPPDQV